MSELLDAVIEEYGAGRLTDENGQPYLEVAAKYLDEFLGALELADVEYHGVALPALAPQPNPPVQRHVRHNDLREALRAAVKTVPPDSPTRVYLRK